MADIRVPTLGESVTEATIGRWFKHQGDAVAVDEPVVELETDKVTIEVPAPAAGVLAEILVKDGETVAPGALLGQIKEGAAGATKAAPAPAAAAPPAAKPAPPPPKPAPAPTAAKSPPADAPLAPSVRKLAAESGISASTVPGSGKDVRITKGDMLAAIERAGGGRRHLDRHLVGFQLDERLVHGDRVARLLEPFADRRLGHRLAKSGHANLSHGLIPRSPDRWRRDNGRQTTEDGEEILDLSLVVLRRR